MQLGHHQSIRGDGIRFQSSPDPEAGCNALACFFAHLVAQFQSSPDPEAGCNEHTFELSDDRDLVSILTRPGGRVQHTT